MVFTMDTKHMAPAEAPEKGRNYVALEPNNLPVDLMASDSWDGFYFSDLPTKPDPVVAGETYIESATVTGFAQQKNGKKIDYVFVVELEWSDQRTSIVKRSFMDFHNFHHKLLQEFSRAATNEHPKKISSFLPAKKIRKENTILLAETRELQLNRYVKELLKLPSKVSRGQTVLSFFESWSTDPQPYREPVDYCTPQLHIRDYVLCFI